jgi:hypothetical protein
VFMLYGAFGRSAGTYVVTGPVHSSAVALGSSGTPESNRCTCAVATPRLRLAAASEVSGSSCAPGGWFTRSRSNCKLRTVTTETNVIKAVQTTMTPVQYQMMFSGRMVCMYPKRG